MTTHKCPRIDCERQVSPDKLACPRHWYKVSPPTRARVWNSWRARSDDHPAAITAAIEEMNAQGAAKR